MPIKNNGQSHDSELNQRAKDTNVDMKMKDRIIMLVPWPVVPITPLRVLVPATIYSKVLVSDRGKGRSPALVSSQSA